MGRRARYARTLAAVAGLIATAGCTVVVGTPPPGPASAPQPGPPAGGKGHWLARISDEGQVTYSVTLTRCHTRDSGQLPDARCTPGSVDPAVTQANIGSTICRSGYTERVRPPESQTERAKYDVTYPAYHIAGHPVSELDHLVSLELGGSNDISNLWPELGHIPNPKDTVENALNRAVCDHKVSLAAAQRAIATDWLTALRRLGLG